jgi:pyrroloquinoline quinone biosynthesis protein B
MRQGLLRGKPRSQAQLALSTEESSWWLVNASPDLRYQIESFPSLHPQPPSIRHSPIAGIVLLSAEVDASLGLLLLREWQPLTVYATDSVRQILTSDNSMFDVLRRQANQVTWRGISPESPFFLGDSGIACDAISTGGGFPGFVSNQRAAQLNPSDAVLGCFFECAARRIGFFPGAPGVKPEWLGKLKTCDVLFFDGTFWADDELSRLHGSGKTARQMGHLPVADTLRALAGIAARKILIHINNTNPILDEESPEFGEVRDAGWEIAYDGMDLVL